MSNPNQEFVVYVDKNGVPTGETAPKLDAHTADTRLHLAFSCYIFNDLGQILVTRRALTKKVWPGVWTNSVCGHPAPGEMMFDAIARRADYELGMKIKDIVVMLPNYSYITPPFNGIVENEFCPVHLARMVSMPSPNPDEVDDYKWMDWADFVSELQSDTTDTWSFWCKDQVRQFDDKILAPYISYDR